MCVVCLCSRRCRHPRKSRRWLACSCLALPRPKPVYGLLVSQSSSHIYSSLSPCRQERHPPDLTNNSSTNSTCIESGATLASGDEKHVVNLFNSRRKPAWLSDFPRFRDLVAPSNEHCRSPLCDPIGWTLAALRVSPELLSFHQMSIERKSGVQNPVRR